jgi:hypothetical protein
MLVDIPAEQHNIILYIDIILENVKIVSGLIGYFTETVFHPK